MIGPAKQGLGKEKSFEAVATQIEPVHRAVYRISQMPTDLGQGPLSDGSMGGNETTHLRQKFIKMVKCKDSTHSSPQERLHPVQPLVNLLHSCSEGQSHVFIHPERLAGNDRHLRLFQQTRGKLH